MNENCWLVLWLWWHVSRVSNEWLSNCWCFWFLAASIELLCNKYESSNLFPRFIKKNLSLKLIRPLNPEVIIGGPPCQDFSSAGEREEGERANLTISYAKIIKSIRPKYFVMENVSRAKSSNAYTEARSIFKSAGYGLTEQILDASRCGVPQKENAFSVLVL